MEQKSIKQSIADWDSLLQAWCQELDQIFGELVQDQWEFSKPRIRVLEPDAEGYKPRCATGLGYRQLVVLQHSAIDAIRQSLSKFVQQYNLGQIEENRNNQELGWYVWEVRNDSKDRWAINLYLPTDYDFGLPQISNFVFVGPRYRQEDLIVMGHEG